MTVQHNHNIEDELRLGLFLQVQFHSCENGMQEYLVRKRRWLLVKDTFICNLYCVDSNGDFSRTEASDRSPFVGSDHDLHSILWNDLILGIRKHRCDQTYLGHS